jgi:hypothetical protein
MQEYAWNTSATDAGLCSLDIDCLAVILGHKERCVKEDIGTAKRGRGRGKK